LLATSEVDPRRTDRRHQSRPGARLTPKQVEEIRELATRGSITQRRLAKVYEVSEMTISRIVTGATWRTDDA
jgi:plasmid maintenance system antidote protein VapI